MQHNVKRILIKTLRVIGWIAFSIVALLLLIIAVVQIPAVQQKITQKAVAFLEKKIGTPVTLESLYISFPKSIVLKGLFLEDQAKDTLLYAGKLSVDTDLWALTHNEIRLNDVSLENTTAFIKRAEHDSAFNYSYIVEAFAGDATTVPDTLEQKAWNFSLKTVGLENIKAHYDDHLTGNSMHVTLGAFELSMNRFDLEHNVFDIESIELQDTRADLKQTRLREASKTTDTSTADTTSLPHIDVQNITLKNINATYTQQVTGLVMRLALGETELEANKIDLQQQVIDLEAFTLKNTFVAYQQHAGKLNDTEKQQGSSPTQSSQPAGGKPAPPVSKKSWQVSLSDIALENNSLQFYDFTKHLTREAVDFDHLWITNLDLDAGNLAMRGSTMEANLKDLSFNERSGFSLRSLQAKVNVSNDSASIKDFVLTTANSKLQLQASASFESLEQLAETYGEARLRTELKSSYIGVRDILFFGPTLLDSLPLALSPQTRILADAALSGTVNNLSIHHLVVRTLSDTHLEIKGAIAGLPETKDLHADLDLQKLFTTRSDLLAILPDTLLTHSIALPEWMNIHGSFKGTALKARFTTELSTPIGSVSANGNMNLDSTSTTRGFTGNLAVNEFNLGALLMQPQTIGKLNLQAALTSEGLTRKEINSAVEATVKSFEYQGYRYENLKVNGKIKDDVLQAWVGLHDKNIEFALEGDYNFSEEIPRYNFTFDLRNADFKALKLTTRPLKARGILAVNMATADFKVLNGSIGLRKVAIFNGDDLYAVDSLLFASIDQEGRSEINIDSDIMKGRFAGSINIFELPAVMREYFNTYYSLHDSVEQSYEAPQHFNFNLKLTNTDLITDILVPQLTALVPGEIKGEFDSKRKQLTLKFDLAQVQYSNIGIRSLLFTTNSDSAKLNYNIFVDKVYIDSLLLDGLEFNGTVAHDSIRTNVIVLDSISEHKYVLGGTFFSHEKEFGLKLNPEEIMLNYVHWRVPKTNYLRFGGPKVVARNVEFVNGREKIMLESKPEKGTPIFIGFRELNLEYLVSMVAQHKPLSGLLQGDINIFTDQQNLQFTSDIRINNLSISEIPWGDLSLAVQQKVKDRFDVDFTLAGTNSDIRANGFYTAGQTPAMNLTTTIEKFDLAAAQPLINNQVQNLKGLLTGNINVKGSPQKPDINGSITLRDINFLSTYLKTAFTIKDETVTFNNRGIAFDKFQVADAMNNTAILDGMIITPDYKNFRFRLDLVTSNFALLNTSAGDNDMFYGKVDINANARIRGTMENPSVDMEVSLADGNNLTYVVPQSEAAVLEQEGIVKFVDKTFKADPFMKKVQRELADTIKSTFTGIDLTAKVELTDNETFTVIIDPTTKDQLTVKGNTTLTLKMDRTGDMQLSGRYEIKEGTYSLSFYKFVKRQFKIEEGSTMTWSGDPLNAAMDIRAIFDVQTSPIDLMGTQIAGEDATITNQYRERLRFQVYLLLKGQLLKPDISFKLDMLPQERNKVDGVYARLQDINTRESDLNKQVFALLILKRFIADNPFDSRGGSGLEGTARTSVSKILTEQLNRLSEKVKGVELSFDVKSYEDYTSGQGQGQTELQLGLSKSLMNDRLVVKLSGNVDIEGENANQDVTDYIGDLALEYKLTDDGRFRITGFRNSDYDMIDGELTETGAGLIYIKDYNTLRELFKANAKEKR